MNKTLHLWHILLYLVLALSLTPLSAQEIQFSGNLSAQAGCALPYTENRGSFLMGNTIFEGTMKSYLGDSMAYINGSFIYDAIGSLSTNGTEALVSDGGNFALKLKEAYIDYNGGWWALRAGRQISGWGKADGLQVADILCPQDASVLIAADYKESRIGIDALRLSIIGNFIQFDAYWIPFFTPSTLPLSEGNPLNQIIFPAEYEEITVINPQNIDEFDLPEKSIVSSEAAARFSAYFSTFDFSLYAFYGWDDIPFVSYTAIKDTTPGKLKEIQVTGKYERFFMVGADAAIPAGPVVFRLESAFFPLRYQQTSAEYQINCQLDRIQSENAKRCNQLTALTGLDWDAGNGWTLTAQYWADAVFADETDISELERDIFQHQATLSVEKTLLNETLSLSLEGCLDLIYFSSATELTASYSLSDSINLSLIGNFFFEGLGGKQGMYGNYFDLNCLTLKAKVSF